VNKVTALYQCVPEDFSEGYGLEWKNLLEQLLIPVDIDKDIPVKGDNYFA